MRCSLGEGAGGENADCSLVANISDFSTSGVWAEDSDEPDRVKNEYISDVFR